jgi:hypothetical protein
MPVIEEGEEEELEEVVAPETSTPVAAEAWFVCGLPACKVWG